MRAPDDARAAGPGGVDDLIGRKAGLRDVIRARDSAFAHERRSVSEAIAGHLIASELWRDASTVMAYLAMRSEVDLDGLWSVPDRPALGVPRIAAPADEPLDAEGRMSVARLDDPIAQTEPGRFGVRAAKGGAGSAGAGPGEIEPASLDVVLVPGLAFDISGNRLGRGGGYYDRFLAGLDRSRTVTVGVCWSGRVVASVPVGPSDIRVCMLLTEHGLEPCRG